MAVPIEVLLIMANAEQDPIQRLVKFGGVYLVGGVQEGFLDPLETKDFFDSLLGEEDSNVQLTSIYGMVKSMPIPEHRNEVRDVVDRWLNDVEETVPSIVAAQ